MKRVKVTPVVSQTSSKTGTFVLSRAIDGESMVDDLRAVTACCGALRELKALADAAAMTMAQNENFIFCFQIYF